MLRQHPKVLSISEFFSFITDLGSRIPQAFPVGEVSSSGFWQILSALYPKQNMMLRHKVAMDEVLYPDIESARYTYATGVPAILQVTLPHLTPEHDCLFAELQAFILAQAPATIEKHYVRLFRWLQRRFARKLWVERSGGSLRIVHRLSQAFPDAKFIHMVRDGRNCALSMSQHLGFRMALTAYQFIEILGVDPYESADRTWQEDLPDELVPLLPENFTGAAFRAYETAPALCGHYWSGEIMSGLQVLAAVPPSRLLQMRYEDFLVDPIGAPRKLITFLGPNLSDEAWIEQVAAQVGTARSSWQQLPAQEQAWLQNACRPGFAALADYGLVW
jgi:putative sulfotransferase